MKKLSLLAAILVIFTLLGCSNDRNKETKVNNEQKTVKKTTKTKNVPHKLSDFKTALENEGLQVTEQEKSSAIIQADEGIGYVLDDGSSVEVYKYKNGEMFNEVKKDKELLGNPVKIFGNFVVMIVNETSHQTEIDKALEKFK